MKQFSISFIIPTYNEECLLPKVLKSIDDYTPSILLHEIIVADNGSQDSTVKIARAGNVKVFVNEDATVGGLRNLAVSKSSGRVLVFLDADVMLTQSWSENIDKVYRSLIEDPWQITGSRCGLPENTSWIERYWFWPLIGKNANYINSGHLITTFDLFDRIGGFDENLQTGEDYALSQEAITIDATIKDNSLLKVVHEGYPKTLMQFIRREIWHGRGDCSSIASIMKSKVAKASLLLMGLHLISLVFFIWLSAVAGMMILVLIVGICVASAIRRHRARSIKSIFVVSILYYCYYASRFISCLTSVSSGHEKRRHR